jgi:uncharacterized MAPEG superfamily protein
MTILISCLFIALLLPFIAKIPLAIAMKKQGHYDNNHPRSQQEKLEGKGARALAAHQNAFESLIIFTPAVLLAIITQPDNAFITQLAVTHVIARIVYNVLYVYNLATLRSLAWFIGIFCSFSIIWQCLP